MASSAPRELIRHQLCPSFDQWSLTVASSRSCSEAKAKRQRKACYDCVLNHYIETADPVTEGTDLSGKWVMTDIHTRATSRYLWQHDLGSSSFFGEHLDNGGGPVSEGTFDVNVVSWKVGSIQCRAKLYRDGRLTDGEYFDGEQKIADFIGEKMMSGITRAARDVVCTATIKQVGGGLEVDYSRLSGEPLMDGGEPVTLMLNQEATVSKLESETRARVAHSTENYPKLVKFMFLDPDGHAVAGAPRLEQYQTLTLKITIGEIDAQDKQGLFTAARSGHTAIVKLFLMNGGDKDATTDSDGNHPRCREGGHTPLHAAAFCGHLAVVEHLVKEGAHKDARIDYERCTPLHMATGNGHVAVVEHLVKVGANVNTVDRFNRGPLHWAAGEGRVAVVEHLVKAGAMKDFTDFNGMTPLDIAKRHGHKAVVKLLTEEEKDSFL